MTLSECNDTLIAIAKQLKETIISHNQAERKYHLRFWDLLLHSGMGTIVAKEAEANLVCQEEGLLEPLQILRADLRALLNEKECYIEISRNLRVLTFGEEKVDKK